MNADKTGFPFFLQLEVILNLTTKSIKHFLCSQLLSLVNVSIDENVNQSNQPKIRLTYIILKFNIAFKQYFKLYCQVKDVNFYESTFTYFHPILKQALVSIIFCKRI